MSDRPPENFLPSIALLLKEAGAARATPIDTSNLARQPVFGTDRWKESIGEFLRWSGSTLAPGGEASVFELVLGHGRVGALAVYRAFRDYLLGRGGAFDAARAKLEAVRIIPSMAAHWLRLIDWDLEDAESLEPADFRDRGGSVVRIPAELSERVRKAAAKDPAVSSAADLVERAVEEKVDEMESDHRGRPRLKGNGPEGQFTMGRAIHDLWMKPRPSREPSGTPPPRNARGPRQEF